MDSISGFITASPIISTALFLIILCILTALIVDPKDNEELIEVGVTYDIRCTLPGQLQIVFQDIPEGDFNFDYDGIVCVEKDGKSHYLPLQYTTILPNV